VIKAALLLLVCTAVLVACGSSEETKARSSKPTTTASAPPPLPPLPPPGKRVSFRVIVQDEQRMTRSAAEIFSAVPAKKKRAGEKTLATTKRFIADVGRWNAPRERRLREIKTMLVAIGGSFCEPCNEALRDAQQRYGG
jgi:type IV secretory pathway VirB10-like protein